jgi:hypothetical protein
MGGGGAGNTTTGVVVHPERSSSCQGFCLVQEKLEAISLGGGKVGDRSGMRGGGGEEIL